MKKIIGYLLLMFLCFATVGCFSNRITKGYDFSGAQLVVDQKDLAITAALIGTATSAVKEGGLEVTIRKSPYTLSVIVTSNTGYYREARVSGVYMMNENNKNLLPSLLAPAAGKFSETPAGNIAQVSFKNLELPFEKIFLTADLEIMTKANSIIKQTIQFSFEPSYSEEKTKE
jgi:hypothetical protein